MEAQRQLDDTVSYRREMGVRVLYLLQKCNSLYIQFLLSFHMQLVRENRLHTSQVGAVGQLARFMS